VPDLAAALAGFSPQDDLEAADLQRVRALGDGPSAWARNAPFHVTGSALVLHPPSGRVLLRWHERQQAWLQVGGHGDPGETDPFAVARREAEEETGLTDLRSWPDAGAPLLVHLVVVPVPAGKGEPAHEHADLRYLLATGAPDAIVEESEGAPLRWLTIDAALAEVAEDNLRVTLDRVRDLFASGT